MNVEFVIAIICSAIAYVIMIAWIFDQLEKPCSLSSLLLIPKDKCIIWDDFNFKKIVQIASLIKWIPVINLLTVIACYVLTIGLKLYIESSIFYETIKAWFKNNITFK